MKKLRRAIDRLCQRHRRFGIPRLMLGIVIITAAVYLLDMMDTTGTLMSLLQFSPDRIMRGEVWRLISWVFIPISGNNPIFVLLSLYFYYFIGNTLEREWGTGIFTVYYAFGILLNLIGGFLLRYVLGFPLPLTSSYLNLSMFFAFAVLFPNHVIMLFFIIPVKIKWLAWFDAAWFVWSIISYILGGIPILALIPVLALLNFAIFCGEDLIRSLRPMKARTSSQAIDFKKAAKKARLENEPGQSRHKCSVCGKTDLEHPDLEFRYCSRCNGYHCFCIDHINNHVHYK